MKNREKRPLEMCCQINKICSNLKEAGLISGYRCHKIKSYKNSNTIKVWWRCPEDADSIDNIFNEKVTTLEYKDALDRKDYSFLLNDGSVVQMLTKYENCSIISYRYAYLPCPVPLTGYSRLEDDSERMDEFEETSVSDVFNEINDPFEEHDVAALIEAAAYYRCEEECRDKFLLAAPVRFEWNAESHAKDEPKSHVHFGRSKCRIALSHPISVWDFIDFIFKNFYSNQYDDFKKLFPRDIYNFAKATSKNLDKNECILGDEKMHIHFLVPDL